MEEPQLAFFKTTFEWYWLVCQLYASRQFMLIVDHKIVNDQISTFIPAVCLMFRSYYCLNIHYPVDLGSTLEFLQRHCIQTPMSGCGLGGNNLLAFVTPRKMVLLHLPVVVFDMDLINLFALLLVYPSDQIPVLSKINSERIMPVFSEHLMDNM